jgi:signal transduction histidine kinase
VTTASVGRRSAPGAASVAGVKHDKAPLPSTGADRTQDRPGPLGAWAGWRPPARGLPWVSSVVIMVVQVVGCSVAAREQTGRTELDALGYVLLVVGPALLTLRRRAPVAVAAVTGAVLLVYVTAGYPYGPIFLSVVVAFFSAVVAGHRRAVLITAGVIYMAHLVLAGGLYRWLPPSHDSGLTLPGVSASAAWLLVVLAGSELARVRREQAVREQRERAEAERRRVDGERLRIARELHDVLAHSISVVNVQAGVALTLMDERPEQARTALVAIKAASKEALGEVRQVLDTLRADGDAPRAPAPGLDRLPELVEQAAGAGLAVDTHVDGPASALPPATDLAAFRIIQVKLDARDRAQLVVLAYESGLVRPGWLG